MSKIRRFATKIKKVGEKRLPLPTNYLSVNHQMGNFKEDITTVRAFAFDVDGVFTDGGITVTPEGDYLRTYNSKDGYAVAYALKQGYKVAIISGGRGKSLETRFNALKVTKLWIDVFDKVAHLKEFMDEFGLKPGEVMFMGDDLPDYEAMELSGMPVCPADSATEIKELSRYISHLKGGEGCVRDVIEQVLRVQGKWRLPTGGFNVVPSG